LQPKPKKSNLKDYKKVVFLPSIFALVFLPGILCKALGVEQLGLSVCPLVPRPGVQERQIEEIPENIGKIFVKFYF